MKTIFVNTESKKYPIYISQGIIKQLYSFINKKCSQIIIISQDLVYNQCHGDIILNQLKNEGFSTNIILVENSESAKNIDNIKNVYNQMVQLDCNRNTLLIAYGGGVVGDITGFIASTFMRGIQYIQIPTTLLAMIDSSIGGKTGINFENIKNYIGTFYQPEKVIIDPNLTLTLSSRNKTAALGEIIKYAIIYDKSFFNKINLLIHNNQIFDMNYLKQIIYDCCLIKANIISKDEFDLKDRQYLNFGHTFAHAIESYLGLETVKHGEAVLMGMQFAVQLSYYLN